MSDTFTINDRSVLYQDKGNLVHACKGSDVHRGVRLIWTLCGRDVPANGAFCSATGNTVTCDKCLARLAPPVR